MRKITAFYAWQSDTAENFNRRLIHVALLDAAKRISDDPVLQVELKIDSDTAGVPGTPPVTQTILSKIEHCDIFIPDVTFVAQTIGGKLVPNPNVMTEYGFALRAKTHTAMMPVMNTAFGPAEKLPFDMGHLRHPVQYHLEPTAKDAERREARAKLSQTIENKLREQIAATQTPVPPPSPFPRNTSKDGPARFRAPGDPIGIRFDDFPFRSGENKIVMASGPAIWLRLIPAFATGKTWPVHELKKNAISGGSLNLAPFYDGSISYIRAGDGVGICHLLAPQDEQTTSVAFAFESGEVWGIDTTFLQYSPDLIPFLEPYFTKCLESYGRFLAGVGVVPPYQWIAGLVGVLDRRLQFPPTEGQMRIPGWPGPRCLVDMVVEEGPYDGKSAAKALAPFFETIFNKCGLPRPDHLSR
jgi:hypothetical protein